MDDVEGCSCGKCGQLVTVFGDQADKALDLFVGQQAEDPANFKTLVEVLMNSEDLARSAGCRHEFFLSTLLATAIIRLGAQS